MTLQTAYDAFRKGYIETRLRPTTAEGYMTNMKLHVLPSLGGCDLDQITVNDLDVIAQRMRENGYKTRTVVYALSTLRKLMNWSIKRGWTENNVFGRYDMPKVQAYNYVTLTEDQITRLLAVTRGTCMHAPLVMALCYGLRRGEVLGINIYTDYDKRTGTLKISRTRTVVHGNDVITPCKTKRSQRVILIAEPHRSIFQTHATQEYLDGLTPAILDKALQAVLRRYGFPRVRFHDLRHSYATMMLNHGINPKIVQSVLGHSSVSVTLDIYSHPTIGLQEACVQIVGGK